MTDIAEMRELLKPATSYSVFPASRSSKEKTAARKEILARLPALLTELEEYRVDDSVTDLVQMWDWLKPAATYNRTTRSASIRSMTNARNKILEALPALLDELEGYRAQEPQNG